MRDTDGAAPSESMSEEDTKALRMQVEAIRKARPRTLVQQVRYWGSVAGAIVGLISLSSAVYSGYRNVRAKLDDVATKQDIKDTIQVHIGSLAASMTANLDEHKAKLVNHETRLETLEKRRAR